MKNQKNWKFVAKAYKKFPSLNNYRNDLTNRCEVNFKNKKGPGRDTQLLLPKVSAVVTVYAYDGPELECFDNWKYSFPGLPQTSSPRSWWILPNQGLNLTHSVLG